MKTLGKKLGVAEDGSVWFFCNGCGMPHSLKVNSPGTGGPNWGYNGNPDAPTFTPSVLVRGVQKLSETEYEAVMRGETVNPIPFVCHSFVTDGKIQYLGDCGHSLANQTVELPDWEASWENW